MNPVRLTTIAVVALVALRLGCGWLFFREGSKKLDSDKFDSTAFLRDAKGPLAGAYLGMVPDIYGHERLNFDHTKEVWDYYYNDASGHFEFEKAERDEAKRAYDRAVAQLRFYLDDISEDLDKYYDEVDRLENARIDSNLAAVNFRSTWMDKKEKELDSDLKKWLSDIDAIWDGYEEDINAIARKGKLEAGGREMSLHEYYRHFSLPRPGEGGLSASFANRAIPWFTFIVGVLLVLGLFTRVAAVGGAAFLLSVVASQPPFMPGAADTNYQIILMLALLFIAAVGAGRWGGLDFFLGLCWNKCFSANAGRRQASSEPVPAKKA